MAKFPRPTIQSIVKPSDLKKAIVEQNKRLAESIKIKKQGIKSLESDKKQAEKDLCSARGDCEEVFNELKSAGKELAAVQESIPSAEAKLKGLLEASSETYSSSKKLKTDLSKLENKHKNLVSKINHLHKQEEEYKPLTQSLEMLNVDIECSTDKLSKLKTSKSRFKKQTDDAAKKCNQMLKKRDQIKVELNQATRSFEAELKIIDKDLSIARIQCEKDKDALQDAVVEKNLKMDRVDSMISKAERELSVLEKKISVAKNNILEEESRQEKIKDNFKNWKVTAVEELARMKLRGKIENIDKAGLKDVLSR